MYVGYFARCLFAGVITLFCAALSGSFAHAQTGSLADPFTHTSQAHNATVSGRYYFDLGSGVFQANVDTSNGGGWILVGQYRHKGGTNPVLDVRAAGDDFPVLQSVSLGVDGSLTANEWGHAGNAAMSQFQGAVETRFYGQTGNHSRILHFSTTAGAEYIKTGIGSFQGLHQTSKHTLLSNHSANAPAITYHEWVDKGDYAFTEFPFYYGGTYHWGIRGGGDRWSVDDYPGDDSQNTHHQIYARTSYDRSDAPLSYGDTEHTITTGLRLGALIDLDTSSIASANADGDGADDDGVTIPTLTQGASVSITVAVQQASASDGYLQGWIDWNGDGDFSDSGEQIATNLQYSSGTSGNISVSVTVPTGATTIPTFARFRWSTTSGLNSSVTGADGEVEDYKVTISHLPPTSSCPVSTTNVAMFGTATQISDYAATSTADKAIDGSTNSQYNVAPGVTHTNYHQNAWWYLDLGRSYPIDHINVWNRSDGVGARLDNFHLFVSSNPMPTTSNGGTDQNTILSDPNVYKYQHPGAASATNIVPVVRAGRYIKIAVANKNLLHLGEVEVIICGDPDRSDAPTSYGEPTHIAANLKLGALVDGDAASIVSANADGDGADDDGVTIPALYHGINTHVTVAVHQVAASDGYLQGWIDWNGDGDFADAGEQVATDLQYTVGASGNISVPITVPATASTSQTFARFRWSTISGLNSTTAASDGEVEDYAVTVGSVDAGIDSFSCPYIQNMDTNAPLYSSIPYYALGNVKGSNGWYVANSSESGGSSKIASDASGSGKFLMHATASSGHATGDVFGSHTPLTVTPNTDYVLSFKLNNEHTTSAAQIQPSINGTQVGTAVSATGTGTWQTFTVNWNSGTATTATFSLANNTTAVSGNNFGLDEVSFCQPPSDYSDAPSSYGDTTHVIIDGVRLGAVVDGDAASNASASADGDGVDDDGVTIPTLTQGVGATISVAVTQLAASDGYLQGWIDWNGDGDFADTGEQVATDLQYTAGASGNISVPVTPPATATNSQTFARFRWSTTSGLDITTTATSGEVEDYAVNIVGRGQLDAVKSVAIWDPLSEGLYALPDNDVVHTITVSNIGGGATDANSIALIDQVPAEIEFYNGDIDDGGPETNAVSFAQTGGAGLTFSYATDVAYSNNATKPANFASCGYTPSSGYDANVTFICFNPKGAMASGTPAPTFSVSFRARIE